MGFWLAPSGPTRTANGRVPVIVVVDDDRDTRELYRACFDMSGYVTAEAATGEEALAAARRLLPDVVLTDLILPDIDGFVVAKRLKEDPATAAIRVILLTGFSPEDLQGRAAAAGVDRALLKPCLPQVMLREVGRALKRLSEA
jgi:CheY-like chemotaxis protein